MDLKSVNLIQQTVLFKIKRYLRRILLAVQKEGDQKWDNDFLVPAENFASNVAVLELKKNHCFFSD